MSDASSLVLEKKASGRQAAKPRSLSSPAMLKEICDAVGASLTAAFDVKTVVSLDTVGVEPLGDLAAALDDPATAAIMELNGIRNAAMFCLDPPLVYHAVDIVLGADPDEDVAATPRTPTQMDDRLCSTLTEAVIAAFAGACNASMGSGTITQSRLVSLVHEPEAMEITPAAADALCVRMEVVIGKGGRSGKIELHLPLATIDLISSVSSASSGEPETFGKGPWFEHMFQSVKDMELETIGILHTERMTVGEISRLDVGTVLALPRTAINDMPLVLEDGGDLITAGELGSSNGKRIIRLSEKPNDTFLEPMRRFG